MVKVTSLLIKPKSPLRQDEDIVRYRHAYAKSSLK